MSQEITFSQQPAEDAHQPAAQPSTDGPVNEQVMAPIEFSSPGLTPGRRYGTAIMLLALGLFVIGVVFYEGRSLMVSAVLGFLLIAGFVWYLRMIAPTPFTLQLTPDGLVRRDQGAVEPLVIPWNQIARVKEEQFPNGKIIGVMIYARSKHSVYRALVLYRDDLPRFDDFRKALREATLAVTPWQRETVHE